MKNGICPNCKSRNIISNADPVEGKNLSIRVYERPGVIPKGMKNYPLRAWVCLNCGHTQLYVSQPQELRQSYQRSLAHPCPTALRP